MARVQINIRTEDTLRDRLTNISQEEDISLNELVVQTLTEFADKYELERVADDAIPNRAQVEAALSNIKTEILARCRNVVKHSLNAMIQSARSHTFIDLYDGEGNLPDNIKKEITDDIADELRQLGYSIFVFKHDCFDLQRSPFCFSEFDIAVALNQEDLKYYEKIQKDFGEIPF